MRATNHEDADRAAIAQNRESGLETAERITDLAIVEKGP